MSSYVIKSTLGFCEVVLVLVACKAADVTTEMIGSTDSIVLSSGFAWLCCYPPVQPVTFQLRRREYSGMELEFSRQVAKLAGNENNQCNAGGLDVFFDFLMDALCLL